MNAILPVLWNPNCSRARGGPLGILSSTSLAVEVEPHLSEDSLRPLWWQLLLVVSLVAFLYHDIAWRMAHQWRVDPNFSHGIFVPLFSAFVVFQRRKELAAIPARPSWLGLSMIL